MSNDRVLEARIQKLEERHKDMIHKADVRQLLVRIRDEREDVLDNETATDSAKAHRNGVACGMDWCIEELEELLNND